MFLALFPLVQSTPTLRAANFETRSPGDVPVVQAISSSSSLGLLTCFLKRTSCQSCAEPCIMLQHISLVQAKDHNCNALCYPKACTTSILLLVLLSLTKVTFECSWRTTFRIHRKHFLGCN